MRTSHEEHKEKPRSGAIGKTPKSENEGAFAPCGGASQDHAARLVVGEEMAFSVIIGNVTGKGNTNEYIPTNQRSLHHFDISC